MAAGTSPLRPGLGKQAEQGCSPAWPGFSAAQPTAACHRRTARAASRQGQGFRHVCERSEPERMRRKGDKLRGQVKAESGPGPSDSRTGNTAAREQDSGSSLSRYWPFHDPFSSDAAVQGIARARTAEVKGLAPEERARRKRARARAQVSRDLLLPARRQSSRESPGHDSGEGSATPLSPQPSICAEATT
jgi:hypothetical protein